ncbi:MAG TPA: LLM class flavin-dependent oxidoreductase [Candidatus Saccharimonadales bacterium]|nr:LLM class flavin-dependent oxidoreductase [Candidatus Saccharimonadales bacterium]
MDIGIGLPSSIPGTRPEVLLRWAVDAEEAGFSSLGVLDRVVYPNYEPFVALSAVAAVTKRVRLVTTVLIAPVRINAALLAKQAASLDRLSNGRFVFGTGLGGRDDDYESGGVPTRGRGKWHDLALEEMRRVWSGASYGLAGGVGPEPSQPGGPVLIIGGRALAVFRRAAKYADGWVGGVGSPDSFPPLAAMLDDAWAELGRSGKPRKLALAFYALGPDAVGDARRYVESYSGYLGPERTAVIAAAAATTPTMIREYIDQYVGFGCDELIFVPCSNEPRQVELLAAASGLV